jgi:hypothetical protein
MSRAIVVGNGESRRSVNLESYRSEYTLIGCNGIHRDTTVDHLVCCDRRMVAEAITNPNISDTLIYVRDSWYHYFRKILKNKRIQHLPPIPVVGELKRDQPDHWGSGCYAVLLAAHLEFKDITLIGFDLYPVHDRVNNLYKGTENYARVDAQAVDYSYWVYHTSLVFKHYPNTQFTIVNHANWKMPTEWQKNNVTVVAL